MLERVSGNISQHLHFSHTAHQYNFECYLNSYISSGNHSIKLREAKGHPRLASSYKSLV